MFSSKVFARLTLPRIRHEPDTARRVQPTQAAPAGPTAAAQDAPPGCIPGGHPRNGHRAHSVSGHASFGGVEGVELEDDMHAQVDAQSEESDARCTGPRRACGDLHPWLCRDQQRRPVHADALGAGESLI